MREQNATTESRETVRSPSSEERPSGFDIPPNIEGYQIDGVLGRGGMGVVYRAVQTSLGRRVALKMVLSEYALEDRARFQLEAETVAQLHHPNIVQIYEIGEAAGRPYFTLEYIDGGSLEDKLGGKPMAWRAAAQLLAVLARAVHAAHLHGVVHRDLKPANVLLAKDGTPKVTDFGIAKRLDGAKQTQTGNILGTPSYMSPEQALGQSKVGRATDIYALGAILYDALVGRPPFEADNTLDTMMQTVQNDPVPPRALQPKLPHDLEVICLKCLEKAPSSRYETALELAEDLERLLRNEPIHARPIGLPERAVRWARRNRVLATFAIVSLLATVGLLATWARFTRELSRELRSTELARKDATAARNDLRLRLIRSSADNIDRDLRQLSDVPRVIADALQLRVAWTEDQLEAWLRAELARQPHLFGMAIAFEPKAFRADVRDFALYVYRGPSGITAKQLLLPAYTPIYREWPWYRDATQGSRWSEPYVDEGGGEIPMVTFSVPFRRDGQLTGIVTADLSLDYFHSLGESMRSSQFGGHSFAFVTTAHGTIVSHPDARLCFPAPGSTPAAPSAPADAQLWSHILAGETGAEHGRIPGSARITELLFAPVTSTGWSCVAVVPD
jgi:serine/threonine protein kinase